MCGEGRLCKLLRNQTSRSLIKLSKKTFQVTFQKCLSLLSFFWFKLFKSEHSCQNGSINTIELEWKNCTSSWFICYGIEGRNPLLFLFPFLYYIWQTKVQNWAGGRAQQPWKEKKQESNSFSLYQPLSFTEKKKKNMLYLSQLAQLIRSIISKYSHRIVDL